MKPICVIADNTDSADKQVALLRAIPLAKKLGNKIHCLAFCYVNDLDNPDYIDNIDTGKVKAETMKKTEDSLKKVLEEASSAGVEWTLEVVWEKHIAPWIISNTKNQEYLWIVKTGHRSEHLLYTATDQHLIRGCKIPVMIVRGKTWKKKARILAAIDLTTRVKTKQQLNHQVLRHARTLADSLDRSLHCVIAIETSEVLKDLDLIDARKHAKKVQARIAPQLEEIAQQYGLDESHIHIKSGKASRIIPSVANKLSADIVVMGTVARKGMIGALIGNTAEEILAILRTDILTISPDKS